ncbi:MAG: hypothetical protein DYG92_13315 [Leptolyngbya sp. PLA1]|nr:hypothetical protein [Leptolyngbya sp. PLA1]
MGQNALGDGRGLERRLEQTGAYSGNVPRPDFRQEIRMRNAVVTGNAGGGKSFRGSISYTDPDDFRGSLGSDSLFRFRRDSFGVGGATNVGLRGTESLQYQFNFATGNARDATFISRSIGDARPANSGLVGGLDTSKLPKYDTSGADEVAPELSTLRSTASFTATRGLSPALVGFTSVRDGVIRVTASELLGVRGDLLVPDVSTGRFVERSKLLVEQRAAMLGPQTGPETSPPPKTAYQELQESLDARDGFDRAKAREEAKSPPPAPPAEAPRAPDAPANPDAPSKPADGIEPLKDPALKAPPSTLSPEMPKGLAPWEQSVVNMRRRMVGLPPLGRPTTPLGPDGLPPLDEQTLQLLRMPGPAISALVGEGEGGSMAKLIREGQAAMARGAYFDAEERFARALAIESGEPSAMAGRVNAQLGAGLYVSAAINLRQLFEQHPELIGVRYEGAALPSAERLNGVKAELIVLAKPAVAERLPRPEAALLLAYLGHHTRDQGAVRDGIAGMREAYARSIAVQAREAGLAAMPDHLIDLLEQAWLETPPSEGK